MSARLGRSTSITDTGRRRRHNEDAYVCEPPLFAVADGMGGAQAGELASRLAAAALEERARDRRGTEALVDLVREANARVYQRAIEDPTAAGMGTTVTVALADPDRGTVAIGHVGDSRAYVVRGEGLEQLTADHSLVAELERSGRLTPEEARVHPQRSVITRALGTEADVEVDTLTVESTPGDLYLLCSDGLFTMLEDGDILAVVESAERDPVRVARALIDAANRAGGEDNVTVVAFEMVDRDLPAEPDEQTAETVMSETVRPAADGERPVNRHGAGQGGRALALIGILLMVVAAALLIWWGIAR